MEVAGFAAQESFASRDDSPQSDADRSSSSTLNSSDEGILDFRPTRSLSTFKILTDDDDSPDIEEIPQSTSQPIISREVSLSRRSSSVSTNFEDVFLKDGRQQINEELARKSAQREDELRAQLAHSESYIKHVEHVRNDPVFYSERLLEKFASYAKKRHPVEGIALDPPTTSGIFDDNLRRKKQLLSYGYQILPQASDIASKENQNKMEKILDLMKSSKERNGTPLKKLRRKEFLSFAAGHIVAQPSEVRKQEEPACIVIEDDTDDVVEIIDVEAEEQPVESTSTPCSSNFREPAVKRAKQAEPKRPIGSHWLLFTKVGMKANCNVCSSSLHCSDAKAMERHLVNTHPVQFAEAKMLEMRKPAEEKLIMIPCNSPDTVNVRPDEGRGNEAIEEMERIKSFEEKFGVKFKISKYFCESTCESNGKKSYQCRYCEARITPQDLDRPDEFFEHLFCSHYQLFMEQRTIFNSEVRYVESHPQNPPSLQKMIPVRKRKLVVKQQAAPKSESPKVQNRDAPADLNPVPPHRRRIAPVCSDPEGKSNIPKITTRPEPNRIPSQRVPSRAGPIDLDPTIPKLTPFRFEPYKEPSPEIEVIESSPSSSSSSTPTPSLLGSIHKLNVVTPCAPRLLPVSVSRHVTPGYTSISAPKTYMMRRTSGESLQTRMNHATSVGKSSSHRIEKSIPTKRMRFDFTDPPEDDVYLRNIPVKPKFELVRPIDNSSRKSILSIDDYNSSISASLYAAKPVLPTEYFSTVAAEAEEDNGDDEISIIYSKK